MGVGHDQSDLLSPSLDEFCYYNRIFARISENWHTHLHSVHWNSTADGNIAKWTCALKPPTTRLRLTKIW